LGVLGCPGSYASLLRFAWGYFEVVQKEGQEDQGRWSSWGYLGLSCGFLEAVFAVLGLSWGHLGAILGHLGSF
jgi:hypothetical protein